MERIKNLDIIGTSHIAQQSIQEVTSAIEMYKPLIIALELDRKRCEALLQPHRRGPHLSDILRVGIKGFLFNLFGAWAERKLGNMVGTPPGSEMKAAIGLAQQAKTPVALIDQDISITLKRLSKTITLKEKLRFLGEIIIGTITKKKRIKIDLTKVPSEKLIQTLTKRIEKQYPSVHQILIKERDEVMAKALYKLMQRYPQGNILAVVGAGHIPGIKQHIHNLDKDDKLLEKRGADAHPRSARARSALRV